MKKHKIFAVAMGIMLLSGCADNPEGISNSMTFTTKPAANSELISEDDGIRHSEKTDDEITVIRCGDNYFTYGVNMYGIWFLNETEIILPDDYEQPIGTAAKLIADTESSSGGFTGGSVCHIKEIKQQMLLGFDEEWANMIPVWGEHYPGDWDHLSEYGYDEFDRIAVIYKYTVDGGVYTVGNTTDKLVVCCDGVEIGRYDACKVLTDTNGRTFERIILCENDIDENIVWQLIESGVRNNDSYFWIGDII